MKIKNGLKLQNVRVFGWNDFLGIVSLIILKIFSCNLLVGAFKRCWTCRWMEDGCINGLMKIVIDHCKIIDILVSLVSTCYLWKKICKSCVYFAFKKRMYLILQFTTGFITMRKNGFDQFLLIQRKKMPFKTNMNFLCKEWVGLLFTLREEVSKIFHKFWFFLCKDFCFFPFPIYPGYFSMFSLDIILDW